MYILFLIYLSVDYLFIYMSDKAVTLFCEKRRIPAGTCNRKED